MFDNIQCGGVIFQKNATDGCASSGACGVGEERGFALRSDHSIVIVELSPLVKSKGLMSKGGEVGVKQGVGSKQISGGGSDSGVSGDCSDIPQAHDFGIGHDMLRNTAARASTTPLNTTTTGARTAFAFVCHICMFDL